MGNILVEVVIDSSGLVVLLLNGHPVLQGKTMQLPELMNRTTKTLVRLKLEKP